MFWLYPFIHIELWTANQILITGALLGILTGLTFCFIVPQYLPSTEEADIWENWFPCLASPYFTWLSFIIATLYLDIFRSHTSCCSLTLYWSSSATLRECAIFTTSLTRITNIQCWRSFPSTFFTSVPLEPQLWVVLLSWTMAMIAFVRSSFIISLY